VRQPGSPSIRSSRIGRARSAAAAEIERAIDRYAREANGAALILSSTYLTARRDTIVAAAAKHRLPAIYPFRYFVTIGGLLSYGIDPSDLHLRATDYVDRILRGAKPGDLAIEQPTKFELVVNLKTAKALGLTIPESTLLRADEVIR
jgi:putative ABC transport system substrate-binding protein